MANCSCPAQEFLHTVMHGLVLQNSDHDEKVEGLCGLILLLHVLTTSPTSTNNCKRIKNNNYKASTITCVVAKL